MTTPCDTSPEVAPSDLPQTYYPNIEQDNWSRQGNNGYTSPAGDATYRNDSQYYQQSSSPLTTKTEAEPQIQATPGGNTGNKPKQRCSVLVIALIIALVVACVVVVGLAAATGVTMKQKQESESELRALHSSIPVSISDSDTLRSTATSDSFPVSDIQVSTATSASDSTSATPQVGVDDISSGCSGKETVSGTIYTTNFGLQPKFTMYCWKDSPTKSFFSVFSGSFQACIESCNIFNNYTDTGLATCQMIAFVPKWVDVEHAANENAPGDCFFKTGPQTRGKLEYAPGAHAAILRS